MKRLIWGLLIGVTMSVQAGDYSLDWYQKTQDKSALVQGFNGHGDINNLVVVEGVLQDQGSEVIKLLGSDLTRKQAQIYQFLGTGVVDGSKVIARQAVQQQFGNLTGLDRLVSRVADLYQQILQAEQRLVEGSTPTAVAPIVSVPANRPSNTAVTGSLAAGSGTPVVSIPTPSTSTSSPATGADAATVVVPQRPPILFNPAALAAGAGKLKPVAPAPATTSVVPTSTPAVLSQADQLKRTGINTRRSRAGKVAIPLNDPIWGFKVNGILLDSDQLVDDVALVNGLWTYVEPVSSSDSDYDSDDDDD